MDKDDRLKTIDKQDLAANASTKYAETYKQIALSLLLEFVAENCLVMDMDEAHADGYMPNVQNWIVTNGWNYRIG